MQETVQENKRCVLRAAAFNPPHASIMVITTAAVGFHIQHKLHSTVQTTEHHKSATRHLNLWIMRDYIQSNLFMHTQPNHQWFNHRGGDAQTHTHTVDYKIQIHETPPSLKHFNIHESQPSVETPHRSFFSSFWSFCFFVAVLPSGFHLCPVFPARAVSLISGPFKSLASLAAFVVIVCPVVLFCFVVGI